MCLSYAFIIINHEITNDILLIIFHAHFKKKNKDK
jgi:hypothetical protein